MSERITAVGDYHPPFHQVMRSMLLAGLDEEKRLGHEGVMRYEAAIRQLGKNDGVETPEINEIYSAAEARDQLAIFLVHKIARVETQGFYPTEEMKETFKRATRPGTDLTIPYVPREEWQDRIRTCDEYAELQDIKNEAEESDAQSVLMMCLD